MKDISGEKFNKLTVIEFSHTVYKKGHYWKCVCDCGNEKIIYGGSLKNGHTKSCGCLQKEFASTLRPIIHGETIGGKHSGEYNSWRHLKERCYTVTNKRYADYGGRGIKVCDRWLGKCGFNNFLEDMGRKPSPKHSIDRIENNGNYEKSNCRWGTEEEQNTNRRSNVWLEYNGQKKLLRDWAISLKTDAGIISRSLNKVGKKFEEIVEFYKKKNNLII